MFPWQERLVELATGACWGGELEQMVKAGEEKLEGKTVRFRRDRFKGTGRAATTVLLQNWVWEWRLDQRNRGRREDLLAT